MSREAIVIKPLVSGQWVYLAVNVVVTYGFINSVLNNYPTVWVSVLACWLVAPLFFTSRSLYIKEVGESIEVVENFLLLGFVLHSKNMIEKKDNLMFIQEKYFGKKYYVIKGAACSIQLFGLKDKENDSFRVIFKKQ